MGVVERIVSQPVNATLKHKKAPVIIEWKKTRMIRNHSIRSTIHEIIVLADTLDVVKINIVGDPSTGKTTLAETIAHLVHKMDERPWAVKFLGEQELLNFEETLKTLTPTNYIIIFDDVSFMGGSAERKQIEKIKQAFTKIRHLEGGQDVKIIAIFNIHYSKALDKYLRQCHFEYFTSIGNSETENAIQHLGVKFAPKITSYQKIWQQAYSKKRFTYMLGKKQKFTYMMRQPFAPLLFSNNNALRHIVSPKRTWIDSICAICTESDKSVESQVSMDEFKNDYTKKFTPAHAKRAVQIKLFINGVNAMQRRTQQAMKYLDEFLSTNVCTLEDVAVAMGIKLEENVVLNNKKRPAKMKQLNQENENEN